MAHQPNLTPTPYNLPTPLKCIWLVNALRAAGIGLIKIKEWPPALQLTEILQSDLLDLCKH